MPKIIKEFRIFARKFVKIGLFSVLGTKIKFSDGFWLRYSRMSSNLSAKIQIGMSISKVKLKLNFSTKIKQSFSISVFSFMVSSFQAFEDISTIVVGTCVRLCRHCAFAIIFCLYLTAMATQINIHLGQATQQFMYVTHYLVTTTEERGTTTIIMWL